MTITKLLYFFGAVTTVTSRNLAPHARNLPPQFQMKQQQSITGWPGSFIGSHYKPRVLPPPRPIVIDKDLTEEEIKEACLKKTVGSYDKFITDEDEKLPVKEPKLLSLAEQLKLLVKKQTNKKKGIDSTDPIVDEVNNETDSTVEIKDDKRVRVIYILDETGSMGSQRENTISSYKEFLESQQRPVAGETEYPKYTLVKFDTKNTVYNYRNITQAEALTKETYRPSGSTALYDAIGCTVAAYKEEEFNILAILTDGEENSSVIHRRAQPVKDLLKYVQEKKNWVVRFYGANPETWNEAGNLGITKAQSRMYAGTSAGFKQAYKSMSYDTSALRSFQAKKLSKSKTDSESILKTD